MTDTVALSAPIEHVPTPIDEYLRRQRELTAVERFASRADHGPTTVEIGSRPASARWWSDRLPATPPGPGQQYGFRVDLDACTGCKACVAACHSLNGLQPEENWRTVGTLRAASTAGPLHRTVTSACHHCVEPACMEGCPANAYEKDPVTGIVRHLDDSCIGCSYCTLTCPYEVPRFDADLGIVRKCDMCADRLSEGEAPACVQGCPTGAITIDVVDVDALVAEIEAASEPALVPGAPVSTLTMPSTRYVSSSPMPADLVADDHASVHPSHGHAPLAVMLVLTQVSVGAFLLDGVLRVSDGGGDTASVVVALLTGLLALGASVLHLGRPLLAWRALLGLGHSWLSREIAAFSVFAGAASAWALASVLELSGARLLGFLVAVSGLVGVACSVAIYATTGRWWWRWPISSARFLATMGVGGALLVATTTVLTEHGRPVSSVTGPAVLLAAVASVATVLGIVGPLLPLVAATGASTPGRTRALLAGPLRTLLGWRVMLGVLGGILVPWIGVAALVSAPTVSIEAGVLLAAATVIAVAAELIERRLFFLASVAPRMPGMAR
ncbi:MAG TPA: DmsC/YnfH family molybdoenzyme membrane anchor subunit [Acidimicrobiales bacterium]